MAFFNKIFTLLSVLSCSVKTAVSTQVDNVNRINELSEKNRVLQEDLEECRNLFVVLFKMFCLSIIFMIMQFVYICYLTFF